MNVCQIMQS